jgi:hypothetical protein
MARCPISLGPDPHALGVERGGGTLEIETAVPDDKDDDARAGHAPVTIVGRPDDAILTGVVTARMPD